MIWYCMEENGSQVCIIDYRHFCCKNPSICKVQHYWHNEFKACLQRKLPYLKGDTVHFRNHSFLVSMFKFQVQVFLVFLNLFDISWWRKLEDYNATVDPTRVTRRSFGVRLLFHQQGVIGKGDGWILGTALNYLYVSTSQRYFWRLCSFCQGGIFFIPWGHGVNKKTWRNYIYIQVKLLYICFYRCH